MTTMSQFPNSLFSTTNFGPGPGNLYQSVGRFLSQNPDHMHPDFLTGVVDPINERLRILFGTTSTVTFAGSGTGSIGIESMIANLCYRGEKILICVNGVFGARAAEMAQALGLTVVSIQAEWGKPVDPQAVRDAVKANMDATALFFVLAETSTGVYSDPKAIAGAAKEANPEIFVLMDCVTGLAGLPIDLDQTGVDAASAGSQKCLGMGTGLFPTSYTPRAVQRMLANSNSTPMWAHAHARLLAYLMQTGDTAAARRYHYTPATGLLCGLWEATRIIVEEGPNAVFDRHRMWGMAFRAGVLALGLKLRTSDDVALPMLTPIQLPASVGDVGEFLKQLREEHGISMGRGLADWSGDTIRVGLMGPNACSRGVVLTLHAIGSVLHAKNLCENPNVGVDAAMRMT